MVGLKLKIQLIFAYGYSIKYTAPILTTTPFAGQILFRHPVGKLLKANKHVPFHFHFGMSRRHETATLALDHIT